MASKTLQEAIRGYDDYILHNGINENVIEAYVHASKVAYHEKDYEYARAISGKAKELINKYLKAQTDGTPWELEKYCWANKTSYSILDTYFDLLKVEAQNKIFDSYLLYLEHKRDPRERFYAPKREQFAKFGIIEAYQGCIDDKYDRLCISLPPGTGKASGMDSLVLTPSGYKKMRDIQVGDYVISGTGKKSQVLGVFPQGKRPMYKVVLDDGSSCKCSDNHLWTVQTRDDRKSNKYRTVELNTMLGNVMVENGKRCNYSIDYVPVIDCFEKENLEIHPYVLGALLGDGGFSQNGIRFTSPDKEVIDKVTSLLPFGYCLKHVQNYDYSLNGTSDVNGKKRNVIKIHLKSLGLTGKKSPEKFIPRKYLKASYEERLELLRGLLDTGGYASKSIEYATTSFQLAKDVVELVRSLGGYASMATKENTGYRNSDGDFVECKTAYRITICFSANQPNPFYLSRKRNAYNPKRNVLKRFITNIEYIGEEECQCIYIDDPSHLYITDDYIITHNTTLLKFFNSAVIGWYPKDYNLFYSHSSDITRMYYDGVYQICSDNQEYAWADLFPKLKISGTNAKMQQFNVGKYKPFPSLQTASVGSENAGKVRASKYLLVDDMIGKLEEALNKNTLEKLWGAYTVDARQRKTMDSNDQPCKEVIQATRWSTMDVIGRIIHMYEGDPRTKIIAVPDTDPVTGESNFDYEYGGFTKEFFNDQALLMDDISYRCLYKQEPVEREGRLYVEDELRRYTSLPDREPDAILGVCDTKTSGVDYMVLPVMYQYDNDFYLVDCICDDSTDFERQYRQLSDIIVEHKMQQCEFESNVGGNRLAYDIGALVEKKGGHCNITTKFTETNKETRIIVNSDWIKKHVLFKLKENYAPKSDYGKFMSQMLSWSTVGRNKHDDVVDCLANFCLYVQRKERVKRAVVVESFW